MELWTLNAGELAAKIASREISAREAAQAALARLEAVNPRINAVVECRPEDVLAQADAVDARLAQGEPPGLLAGVPVTVKVNIDQQGYATTNGTKLQKDLVAQQDGPLVANLRQAGAVILGRTNTPAFSMRWFTDNLLHGATKNPHNPALTPGGSSGGAAAAVAAGIGALAIGTDIAGSIRYPAYACGVQGLRPSLGRIANYNASGPERGIGAQLTAVAGPLARSIADLRLGLAALAAPQPRDIWQIPAPLEGPPAPRHAALCVKPGGMETAPEVQAALRLAAARLEQAGWEVTELQDVPELHEAAQALAQLWLGSTYDALLTQITTDGDPGALAAMEGVRDLVTPFRPEELITQLTRRATLTRDWQVFLARYSVLLLPISAELPFPDRLDMQGPAEFARVWRAQLTQIALPYFGLPGLAVATQSPGAVPCGVQIIAGRYREDLCLVAGEAIEAGGAPLRPVTPGIDTC